VKYILLALLGLSMNAHAVLGGKTAEIEKDLPHIANRSTSIHSETCYQVKEILGDGVGVKQYINTATDTVFMVRSTSRVMMPIQPLMNSDTFTEYHSAQNHNVQKLTRNHKNVNTETDRLKVLIDDRQLVHRSILILKPSVPGCVANAEALP
jgi:Protein of unknown function (DUF2844)